MFSGLNYVNRAYISCHSFSLYLFFFSPFASSWRRKHGDKNSVRDEWRALTLEKCREAKKEGEEPSSSDKLEDHYFPCIPPVKLPNQTVRVCTLLPLFFHYPSPCLAPCLYTPSSRSSSSRQVAVRQNEARQTGIITRGCLSGIWQPSRQLERENAFSSPMESSRPCPTTYHPACLPAHHPLWWGRKQYG